MIKCLLIIAAVFCGKCVKEVYDVYSMGKMTPQEKHQEMVKRNFYDNHA